MREQKILVAYFSHKGENYSNGSIVNLDKGNTEIAAEMIAAHKHAELFEIESETGYPFAYRACVEVSKKELSEDARPKLKEEKSVSAYDTIYIGYPTGAEQCRCQSGLFWRTMILQERRFIHSAQMKEVRWEEVRKTSNGLQPGQRLKKDFRSTVLLSKRSGSRLSGGRINREDMP